MSAEELARRAVACKGWRWMPGMLATLAPGVRRRGFPWRLEYQPRADAVDGTLPDLADPATLGCLLAIVREAWGLPDAVALRAPMGWFVAKWMMAPEGLPAPLTIVHCETEAEALVAALEAAP